MTSYDIRQDETAIPASQVRAGDVVLGFIEGNAVIYHSDSYAATPRPDTGNCGCPEHGNLADEGYDGPAVVLYDGELWDYICDVVPADTLIVIRTRAEDATPDGVRWASTSRRRFTYNGKRCHVYPTPGAEHRFSVRIEGRTVITRRATKPEAVRDAVAYIDGDEGVLTGWDGLAAVLSL